MSLCILQSEAASLKEQVKCVSEDNITLKQALDGATAAIQRNENDYEHSQVRCQIAKWLMSEYCIEDFHDFSHSPLPVDLVTD